MWRQVERSPSERTIDRSHGGMVQWVFASSVDVVDQWIHGSYRLNGRVRVSGPPTSMRWTVAGQCLAEHESGGLEAPKRRS